MPMPGLFMASLRIEIKPDDVTAVWSNTSAHLPRFLANDRPPVGFRVEHFRGDALQQLI